MGKYWEIFVNGYVGYGQYLMHEITHPHLTNFFYWLILVSLFFFGLEIIKPWRKDQPKFRQDLGVLSGLHSHPTQDSTFYVLFSFYNESKIFRTEDLGQNWEDISQYSGGASQNGFPDVAAYCLMVREDSSDIIWVGTDIGLIESVDNGATWALADNGLENVAIWDMKYWDGQVVIGTHGRGVWTADVVEKEVTATNQFTSQSTLTAYPNPASSKVTLEGELFAQPKEVMLTVYSYLGFEVMKKKLKRSKLLSLDQ